MAIQKEKFGVLPGGQEVSLYTITNTHGLSAAVTDLGAAWVRMLVPDRAGKFADVVMGYDDADGYLHNGPHLGVIVGRSANRIGGAKFLLDGKEYTLPKNEGENNLHSGPDFYETRLWAAAPGSDGKSVMFSLVSPDGDQGYPGTAQISVIYRLTDEGALELTYHAQCDQATPLNLTNHAYFNLAGQDAGAAAAMSHELKLYADFFTPADEASIPTGEIAAVAGTPMDFKDFHAIGERIDADYEPLRFGNGYDHNWCLSHARGRYGLAAVVRDLASGRQMEVDTDLPGLQFYAGNFVGGTKGKGGVVYERRGAYCFETQYFPDSVNKPQFPSPILRPGEVYTTKTAYRFSLY